MEKSYIDISMPVHPDMIVWENDQSPEISFQSEIFKGNVNNLSNIKMGIHTGTHIDAPFHFINEGKRIDQIDISALIGQVYVFETNENVVTYEVLKNGNIPETKRLLIKSKNTEFYKSNVFEPDFCALDESAADWLIDKNIKLVGIDYLSIEVYSNKDKGYPVHHKLLSNEVLLLEGLVLKEVLSGYYNLVALPLNILGVEAAPVRALLFPQNSNTRKK